MSHGVLALRNGDRSFDVRYFDRPGGGVPILYAHGLGCSSDDFWGMTTQAALSGRRLLSFDQPGCGGTAYDASRPLNIDDLVTCFEAFVEAMCIERFLLVGGSMGGLIALLYAERNPRRVSAFVNVEGNLRPEDCLFSRHVVGVDFANFEGTVFPKIKNALAARRGEGFARHLQVVSGADPHAYYDYSFQLVEYSDHGRLLERFLALPMAKHFVYGDENRHLSYLSTLRGSPCVMHEIPRANHFPFYDDPAAFAGVLQTCS